jgi:hypothetical protein
MRRSAYNPDARSETVRPVNEHLRLLGGAQDDTAERGTIERLMAEAKQVRHYQMLCKARMINTEMCWTARRPSAARLSGGQPTEGGHYSYY